MRRPGTGGGERTEMRDREGQKTAMPGEVAESQQRLYTANSESRDSSHQQDKWPSRLGADRPIKPASDQGSSTSEQKAAFPELPQALPGLLRPVPLAEAPPRRGWPQPGLLVATQRQHSEGGQQRAGASGCTRPQPAHALHPSHSQAAETPPRCQQCADVTAGPAPADPLQSPGSSLVYIK